MTGYAVTIRNDFISASSAKAKPVQQTWAAYVRQRWPQNALSAIQREWDLTEGEARNLLYAHASLRTIEKIGLHRHGGLRLELDMLLRRWGTSLEAYAHTQEQEHERARLSQEARIQSERLALSRLARPDEQPPEVRG